MKLLLIENQSLIRLGIKSALSGQTGVEIIGEADTIAEGFRLFKQTNPDVTILSLRFPEACAIDELSNFFAENSRSKIIVLADHAGDSEIKRALKKGVSGYICKDISAEELLKAIRVVGSGRKYIASEVAEILSQHIGEEELTPSEQTVLQMIVGAMTNKEIAFALDISENTVKTHVKNIFEKLGVSDRTAATTLAIKRGLVRIDV
jgi:two-component system, NarL family, response regulator